MSRVNHPPPNAPDSPDGDIHRADSLAVEEPLEIRIGGQALTITMRTPGDDIDLVHGFLLSDSIVTDAQDLISARYCAGTDENGHNTYNVLDLTLRTPMPLPARNFMTTTRLRTLRQDRTR